MTQQEIFDKVYVHLLTQNEHSINISGCSYRGFGGNKCAVGCLIPDEKYTFEMEGKTVYFLESINLLPENLKEHLDFLMELQQIHDKNSVELWKEKLNDFAIIHNLTTPNL